MKGGSFQVSDQVRDSENTRAGTVRPAPEPMQRYGKGLPGGDLDLFRGWAAEDGSCFFHSMASALNIDDWHSRTNRERVRIGRRLRSMIRTLLTDGKWRAQWKKTLARDGLLSKMRKIPPAKEIARKLDDFREWADIYLIEWLMQELEISCIFFDQSRDCRMYCGARGDKEADTNVLILWVNNVHFEPIYALHHDDGTMQTSFPRNHPLILRVRREYDDQQCPGAKVAV